MRSALCGCQHKPLGDRDKKNSKSDRHLQRACSLSAEPVNQLSDRNIVGESARWVSTYSSGNVPKKHKVVLRDQERLCRKQQKWLSTLRSEGWTNVSQKKEGKWKGRRDEGEEENEKSRWTRHTFFIHPSVNGHWWMPLSLFGYYAWCH